MSERRDKHGNRVTILHLPERAVRAAGVVPARDQYIALVAGHRLGFYPSETAAEERIAFWEREGR